MLNRIFNVIWSKLKNRYVVVSEMAGRDGRQGAGRRLSGRRRAGRIAAVAALSSVAFGGTGLAIDAVFDNVTINGWLVLRDNIAAGGLPVTKIDMGHVTAEVGLRSHGYLVVGADDTPTGTTLVADRSASIGTNNQIDGQNSLAVGVLNRVNGYSALTSGYQNTVWSYGGSAMGRNNVSAASYSFAGGYMSQAGDLSAFDVTTPEGKAAIQNSTKGWLSFAYGYMAKALGTASTALGYKTTSSGKFAFSAGAMSTASGVSSVALGGGSQAAADNSMAALGGTVSRGGGIGCNR